jgi:hypothetical protein
MSGPVFVAGGGSARPAAQRGPICAMKKMAVAAASGNDRRQRQQRRCPGKERAQLGRAEKHGQLVAEASTTDRAASSGTPCQD